MKPFHCFVQRRPQDASEFASPTESKAMKDQTPEPSVLQISAEARGMTFSIRFDDVYQGLMQLPRMFIEPDGSFVWVGSQVNGVWPWKLDGLLQDGGIHLAFLELKGHCRVEQFDQILMTLGWPDEPVMFQLAREGVFISEAAFRQRFLQTI